MKSPPKLATNRTRYHVPVQIVSEVYVLQQPDLEMSASQLARQIPPQSDHQLWSSDTAP